MQPSGRTESVSAQYKRVNEQHVQWHGEFLFCKDTDSRMSEYAVF